MARETYCVFRQVERAFRFITVVEIGPKNVHGHDHTPSRRRERDISPYRLFSVGVMGGMVTSSSTLPFKVKSSVFFVDTVLIGVDLRIARQRVIANF